MATKHSAPFEAGDRVLCRHLPVGSGLALGRSYRVAACGKLGNYWMVRLDTQEAPLDPKSKGKVQWFLVQRFVKEAA